MQEYLAYEFEDSESFVNTFDEAPLWSAAFGLLLLKHLEVRPNITVVDVGSGAGFPLMELAARLGNSCTLFGVDPWVNANKRARQKIANYGLTNVQIIEASAENIPLADNSVDLIVSNLGINNFKDASIVFNECNRILKIGGKLSLTSNVYGHWKGFYKIFYKTLRQINKENLIPALKNEEEHRGSVASIGRFFESAKFKVTRTFEESMEMNFANGSSFLNHYFVKLGWLTNWLKLFPKQELPEIFSALESDLNTHSETHGGLNFTVPMVFMEGEKVG